MTNRTLTLVYAYYDNPKMLARQLEEWKHYDALALEAVSFILVDDASPNSPALDVVRSSGCYGLDLRVFRVQVDRPWGQDGARNIGMKHCSTDWALMTDMDHLLSRENIMGALDFIETGRARRGRYYLPRRVLASGELYHSHPNSFLFHRVDFWDMGGYDEDFVGYYGSDGNFRKCAKGSGLMEMPVEEFTLILYGRKVIEDASTRSLTRKDGPLWAALHPHLNNKRMGGPYRAVNPFRQPYQQVYG